MLEAGRIDGVGELGLFHRLALPQLTPAIVTVVLFQFVAIWNNYMLPLVMLADEELYPITLGLDNWRAQTDRLPEFYQLTTGGDRSGDRKSTRLNSSHVAISYAVFCLKKKNRRL